MPEINLGRVVGPQGPQGNPGRDGAQGLQGEPGPQGAPGAAATINGKNVLTLTAEAPVTATQAGDTLTLGLEAGTVSNRNLLDNWYFADPINQRGQTEYTGEVYSIDRWRNYGSTCTLQDGYISIYYPGTNKSFGQTIEDKSIVFQEVTLSLLLLDGTLLSGSGRLPDNASNYTNTVLLHSQNCALTIQYLNGHLLVLIQCNQGNTINIRAAKLELGDHQTLAHQDASGNWVLNDPPPDKALELAKCQRHYREGYLSYVNFDNIWYRPVDRIIPVPMRTSPAITLVKAYDFSGFPIDVSALDIGGTDDGTSFPLVRPSRIDYSYITFRYKADANL